MSKSSLRSLSKALRHTPQDFNLKLDEIGGAPVVDVLNQFGVSESELKALVTHDNKNRYQLYTDKKGTARIRAYQGHSFPVSKEAFTILKYPSFLGFTEYLYHGTTGEAWNSIYQSKTLKRGVRQHVHFQSTFDKSIQSATRHKSGTAIVLAIPYNEVLSVTKELYLSGNQVILSPVDVDLTSFIHRISVTRV